MIEILLLLTSVMLLLNAVGEILARRKREKLFQLELKLEISKQLNNYKLYSSYYDSLSEDEKEQLRREQAEIGKNFQTH